MKQLLLAAAACLAVTWSAGAQSRALESQHASGMCLQAAGSAATISRCDGGADQEVDFSGYGALKIRGLCLSTSGGSGTQLVLQNCGNTPTQRWVVNPNGHRGALRNEAGWCADVEGEKTAAGTRIVAYKCEPGKRVNNQRWSFRETRTAQPAVPAQPAPPPWSLDLRRAMPVQSGAGYEFRTTDGKHVLARMDGAGNITVSLPANLVAAGAGNMVAAGAGNMVAAGGGNLTLPNGQTVQMVAAGGGNMVAAGGGNAIAAGTPLASVVQTAFTAGQTPALVPEPGRRTLMSARTVAELKQQQAGAGQKAPPPVVAGTSFRSVLNDRSPKCLDVPSGRYAAGVELQMYDCNNQPPQRFQFTSGGELRIGGFCVDAYGGHGKAGDRIGLWQCNGGPNQKWRFESGQLKGMNNRCMDIVRGNRENGARVILWDCHGGPNQRFSS